MRRQQKLKAVLRRDKRYNDPIIFLIDVDARYGRIVAVSTEGHTEATLEYYRDSTVPAEWDAEFEQLGYKKDELEIKKKVHYRTLLKNW